MTESFPAKLYDAGARKLVEAELIVDIAKSDVDSADHSWSEAAALISSLEHRHWDWAGKHEEYVAKAGLVYRMLGIRCAGEIQGLMLLRVGDKARLTSQAGKELVYVDYVATAPWNLGNAPRFKLVGKVFMRATILLSQGEEFKGRIGLHSLPQAEGFYRTCKMTELGPDQNYPRVPLVYFEMTPEQADQFLIGGA